MYLMVGQIFWVISKSLKSVCNIYNNFHHFMETFGLADDTWMKYISQSM